MHSKNLRCWNCYQCCFNRFRFWQRNDYRSFWRCWQRQWSHKGHRNRSLSIRIVVRCNRCRCFLQHNSAFRHFLQVLRLRSRRVIRLVVIRIRCWLYRRLNIHRLKSKAKLNEVYQRSRKANLISLKKLHNKPAIKR